MKLEGDKPIFGLVQLLLVLIFLGSFLPGGASAVEENVGQAIEYAEQMPLADEVLVLDATPTTFGAVAVGIHGHVLLSEDYESWRQADRVPTRAALTGVDFVGQNGWAVGHEATILHSDDGGTTWERQYVDPEREQPFLDVLFLNEERGIAVGAYGLFMRTNDGGSSWQESQVIAADDWHLNAIAVTSDGTLYIAAEQGIVYRSDDSGDTWTKTDLQYSGSMFDVVVLSGQEVLTFGLRGNAFHTTDGGSTWQPVETGTDASLYGGRVLPGGALVAVGSNGVILEREAGADRFTRREHSSDEPLAGVIQDPSGKLVYYGLNGIGSEITEGEEP